MRFKLICLIVLSTAHANLLNSMSLASLAGNKNANVKIYEQLLWDSSYRSLERPVQKLALSPNGRHLAVAVEEGGMGSIELWDIKTKSCLYKWFDCSTAYKIVFDKSGNLVVAIARYGGMYVWDVKSGALKTQFEVHRNSHFVEGGPCTQYLAAKGIPLAPREFDYEVASIDIITLSRSLRSSETNLALILLTDYTTQIWDIDKGKLLAWNTNKTELLNYFKPAQKNLDFLLEDQLVVSCVRGSEEIQILQGLIHKVIDKLPDDSRNNKVGLKLSGNSRFVIITKRQGLWAFPKIKVWDRNTKKIIFNTEAMHTLHAISADGKVAVGTARNEVVLWNVETNQQSCCLFHDSRVINVVIDFQHDLIIGASFNGLVKLYKFFKEPFFCSKSFVDLIKRYSSTADVTVQASK